MIYSDAKYLCYARQSNRHNWMLTLLANDAAGFERNRRLDAEFYAGWQHGYMDMQADSKFRAYNDLPKNCAIGESEFDGWINLVFSERSQS